MKARNAVVVEETERALKDGCRKIIVLYGGLHMQVKYQHHHQGQKEKALRRAEGGGLGGFSFAASSIDQTRQRLVSKSPRSRFDLAPLGCLGLYLLGVVFEDSFQEPQISNGPLRE